MAMRGDGYLSLNGVETVYSASTGAISDIKTGVLLWFFLSDSPNNADFQCDLNTRLRFVDV